MAGRRPEAGDGAGEVPAAFDLILLQAGGMRTAGDWRGEGGQPADRCPTHPPTNLPRSTHTLGPVVPLSPSSIWPRMLLSPSRIWIPILTWEEAGMGWEARKACGRGR